MKIKPYLFLLLIGLLLPVLLSPTRLAAQSFADPAMELAWQRADQPVVAGRVARSWTWGPAPFTGGLYEPYAESPGGVRLVQYLDKARMEISDPGGDRSSPGFVTNGLIVREMVEGRVQTGASSYEVRSAAREAIAGDPVDNNSGCPTYASFTSLVQSRAESRVGQPVTATLSREGAIGDDPAKAAYAEAAVAYYDETVGHNVPRALWDLQQQEGPIYIDGAYKTGQVVDRLAAMGYPLSEPYWVRCSVAGRERDVLVQLFERRVLTYTPGNSAGWQVEMGNAGRHYYAWRYGSWAPPADDCGDMPADVSGAISPRCGSPGTALDIRIWGFAPNEQVGFWLTGPAGDTIGTTEPGTIGPGGSADLPLLETPAELKPGLYAWVFQGVSSGHQAVLYFKIVAAGPLPGVCADVPAAVNGSITPNCGNWDTEFCMDFWGFEPGESVGFWLSNEQGVVGGTSEAPAIGPSGAVADFCFRPREQWLGIKEPGLYWWVFQGVRSGHQAIIYFLVQDQ